MHKLLFPVCLLACTLAAAQKAELSNTAVPAKKKGYYTWTVFVKADAPTLDQIDRVEYLLHPTFPKPQVSVSDRKTNFGFSATGWGEFEVKAKVYFKNKSVKLLTRWLKFESKAVKANSG